MNSYHKSQWVTRFRALSTRGTSIVATLAALASLIALLLVRVAVQDQERTCADAADRRDAAPQWQANSLPAMGTAFIGVELATQATTEFVRSTTAAEALEFASQQRRGAEGVTDDAVPGNPAGIQTEFEPSLIRRFSPSRRDILNGLREAQQRLPDLATQTVAEVENALLTLPVIQLADTSLVNGRFERGEDGRGVVYSVDAAIPVSMPASIRGLSEGAGLSRTATIEISISAPLLLLQPELEQPRIVAEMSEATLRLSQTGGLPRQPAELAVELAQVGFRSCGDVEIATLNTRETLVFDLEPRALGLRVASSTHAALDFEVPQVAASATTRASRLPDNAPVDAVVVAIPEASALAMGDYALRMAAHEGGLPPLTNGFAARLRRLELTDGAAAVQLEAFQTTGVCGGTRANAVFGSSAQNAPPGIVLEAASVELETIPGWVVEGLMPDIGSLQEISADLSSQLLDSVEFTVPQLPSHVLRFETVYFEEDALISVGRLRMRSGR